jgi:hypothetical protein
VVESLRGVLEVNLSFHRSPLERARTLGMCIRRQRLRLHTERLREGEEIIRSE